MEHLMEQLTQQKCSLRKSTVPLKTDHLVTLILL